MGRHSVGRGAGRGGRGSAGCDTGLKVRRREGRRRHDAGRGAERGGAALAAVRGGEDGAPPATTLGREARRGCGDGRVGGGAAGRGDGSGGGGAADRGDG